MALTLLQFDSSMIVAIEQKHFSAGAVIAAASPHSSPLIHPTENDN
jgi:hypothetical protein